MSHYVVTGASAGIGLETARWLAVEGHALTLIARGAAGLHRAVQELAVTSSGVASFACDVRHADDLAEAIWLGSEAHGAVDGLAAVVGSLVHGSATELSPDSFADSIAVTLLGVVNAVSACLPVAVDPFSVVGVSSIAARRPTRETAALTAGKAGLEGYIEALSIDLSARGGRANTVRPRLIARTPGAERELSAYRGLKWGSATVVGQAIARVLTDVTLGTSRHLVAEDIVAQS